MLVQSSLLLRGLLCTLEKKITPKYIYLSGCIPLILQHNNLKATEHKVL